MKRNFFMKAFVCMFTVVALSSCNKDDDEKEEAKSGAIGNTLTVTVENGNSYNSRIDTVKLTSWDRNDEDERSVELARAVYTNGGFTINLPENLGSQYLSPLIEDEDDFSGVTISNRNVKIGSPSLDAYKSGNEVGVFYPATGTGESDWEGELTYADSDVSITGTGTRNYSWESGDVTYTETITVTYNVNLKKGWNIVYEKGQGTVNGTTYTVIGEVTTAPAGVKWYFYSDDYDESSVSGSRAKTPFLSGKQKLRF
jgi:hypothetical protein